MRASSSAISWPALLGSLALLLLAVLAWELRWVLLVLFGAVVLAVALDVPVHEGLKIEADLSTLAYQTHDADEGMQAFIDKRKPVFGDV